MGEQGASIITFHLTNGNYRLINQLFFGQPPRQWCGRRGNVDNCQVALSLGYVSRKGHTLVDTRLYLPKEWTKDTARLDKAGVPKAARAYRTRHQLALEMREQHGGSLPHRWMAGDDERGRPSWFRRRLAGLGEQYL